LHYRDAPDTAHGEKRQDKEKTMTKPEINFDGESFELVTGFPGALGSRLMTLAEVENLRADLEVALRDFDDAMLDAAFADAEEVHVSGSF
jgi:hypothetical protein